MKILLKFLIRFSQLFFAKHVGFTPKQHYVTQKNANFLQVLGGGPGGQGGDSLPLRRRAQAAALGRRFPGTPCDC